MPPLKASPKTIYLLLSAIAAVTINSISAALSVALATAPAIAHQVELAEDVGGTLHIEPDDTPKAGEEVLAWVALTRKGGETIPLADCDCQINIYTSSQPDTPLLSPAPIAVAEESYQGIPGAEFTFPDVGAYSLVISGAPAEGAAAFSPFELAFEVTVAAGQPIPTIPEDAAAKLPDPAGGSAGELAGEIDTSVEPVAPRSPQIQWITIGMGSAILLGLAAVMLQRSRPKS